MDAFLAFLTISIVVIVTPGQDTALSVRNSLVGGAPAGRATAVGVAAGQLVWTVAAAAGLTALLVASEGLFAAIKLAGAAYLVYLGLASLWSAVRGHASGHGNGHGNGRVATGMGRGPLTRAAAARQGLLSNLGNPKMVIFFSSLLPQFAPPGPAAFAVMLGLGVMFCSMTLVWLCGYAWIVERAGALLLRGAVRRAIDAVTGVVMVAFGLKLATEPLD
jgi:threonine/homoserine/homoserine lactone efflux protein